MTDPRAIAAAEEIWELENRSAFDASRDDMAEIIARHFSMPLPEIHTENDDAQG